MNYLNNIKILCLLFVSIVVGFLFSPQNDVSTYKKWMDKYAREFSVDANLIAAMIMTESSGDVKAVSVKGARGIMQITPATAKKLCKELQIPFSLEILNKPRENILLGSYYIHTLLLEFDGCVVLALAAYNSGPHRVRGWREVSPSLSALALINKYASRETKHFVWSVLHRKGM